MRSLTTRFLEGIAESVEALGAEPSKCYFHPPLAVVSAAAIASAASFTRGVLAPGLVLAASIALIPLLRVSFRAWAKPVAFVTFIAGFVSIPLLFITPGSPVAALRVGSLALEATREGLLEAASLILRAAAASASFTAILLHLGWSGFVEGLRGLRLPAEFVFLVGLYIRYVPVFLRDALSMVAAREARLLRPNGTKLAWGALASVVGDLMFRGYERAWRLEKALRARMFGPLGAGRGAWGFGAGDAALITLTVTLALACVALEVL